MKKKLPVPTPADVLTILTGICTFVWAFGQSARLSLYNGLVNVLPYEILLLIVLSLFIVKYRLQPFKHRPFALLLIWLGYLGISLGVTAFFYPLQSTAIAILYLVRLTTHMLFLMYVVTHFRAAQPRFMKTFAILSGFILVSAFLQYSLYPDLRNLYYEGWDPHLYRMFGLFFEPVIAGTVYTLLGIRLLWYMIQERPQSYKLIGSTAFFIICILATMLTFSRSILAALAVTGTVLLLQTKRVKLFAVVTASCALLLFLVPKPFGEGVNLGRFSTISSRFVDYQQAFQAAGQSPVIGVGYNRIRAVKPGGMDISPAGKVSNAGASFHSSFLIVLVTGGVVGLALFVYALVALAASHPFFGYTTVFLSTVSLFDNVILHPLVLFLWAVLAASVVEHDRKKT